MRTKIVAATLMCLALLHSAFAQDSITLNGSVTGPKNEVVAGATVQLYRVSVDGEDGADYVIAPAGETASDAQGHFTFSVEKQTGSRPAFYTCFGWKDGLSYGWKTLLQEGQLIDVRLTEPQKMIGFLQDPEGRPIPGAEVRLALLTSGEQMNFTFGLAPIDLFVSKTCDQGRFEFDRLPEGASAEILVKTEGGGILHPFVKGADFETGLSYKAGQTEIMLTMQKPCTISGVVVAKEGQAPIEGIHVTVRQEEVPVNLLGLKPVVTAADGTFEIGQLPPGQYVLHIDSEDWITEPVRVEAAGNIGTKIELQKGGLLEVKVVDGSNDQPIGKAGISIRTQEGGRNYNITTDASGIGKKQLLPGNYECYAYAEGFQQSRNAAVAVVESDKTIAIEIRLGGQQKLTGIVKRPDGKPAEDVGVRIMPNQGMRQTIKTDAEGRFTLAWNPEELSWTEGQCFLVAVDKEHHLASALPIDTETKEITVTLQKGATVKGKVLNEKSEPLKNASADLTFWGGNWGSSYDADVKTNADGEYVFTGIPAEQKYSVSVRRVKGYGSSSSRQFNADVADEPVLVEDLVLKVADQKLSGQVVDAEGKGIANASVNLNGEGQPNESVQTDKEGKFKFENVCAGPVSLYANSNGSNRYMYGNTRTEGGAQDVTIVLSAQGGYARYEPKKPSPLAGKDLPELAQYGVEIPADANSVLVFVWDMQQRPSRHFVKQLAAQEESLTAKGVKVVLLNASKVEKESLDKWLADNKVPFACGIISVDPENAKFNLGVQGLPWLILTDSERTVTAEGLAMEDIIKGLN